MGGMHLGTWRRMAGVSVGGALALTCMAAAAADATLAACDGPFATVLQPAVATDARAYWLNRQLIKWPGADASGGAFKLYYSASASLHATPGARVSGADGSLALARLDGGLPSDVARRFKFVGNGAVLTLAAADTARLGGVLTQQVILAQEANDGTVRDATTL